MINLLMPMIKASFSDDDGNPLAYGKLYTYLAGTNTKETTYQDVTLNAENKNPIILDTRGEADVWLNPTKAYKFVLKRPGFNGDTIYTVDNVVADPSIAGGPGKILISNQDETLDYISEKVFSGDEESLVIEIEQVSETEQKLKFTALNNKVAVSENDTTAGFLSDSVSQGDGVLIEIVDPGGDESLLFSAPDAGKVFVSPDDQESGDLQDKQVEGNGVIFTIIDPGGNEQIKISTEVTETILASRDLESIDSETLNEKTTIDFNHTDGTKETVIIGSSVNTPTGVVRFTGLSVVDFETRKINIGSGDGWVSDYYTDPDNPVLKRVVWSSQDLILPAGTFHEIYMAVGAQNPDGTFQGVANATANVYMTSAQHRDNITLGKSVIDAVELTVKNDAIPSKAQGASYFDMWDVLGFLKTGGNVKENLNAYSLDVEAFTLHKPFVNFVDDSKNPTQDVHLSMDRIDWNYVIQDGIGGQLIEFPAVDQINVTVYDNNGVKTNVLANQYTVQRLYYSNLNDNYFVLYGQKVYQSFTSAVQGASADKFFLPDFLNNKDTVFMASIVARGNAADLSDDGVSQIYPSGLIPEIGTGGGSGGASVSVHNALSGLQGGDAGLDQFYHLTLAEKNLVKEYHPKGGLFTLDFIAKDMQLNGDLLANDGSFTGGLGCQLGLSIATGNGINGTNDSGIINISGGSIDSPSAGANIYLYGESEATDPGVIILEPGTSGMVKIPIGDKLRIGNSGSEYADYGQAGIEADTAALALTNIKSGGEIRDIINSTLLTSLTETLFDINVDVDIDGDFDVSGAAGITGVLTLGSNLVTGASIIYDNFPTSANGNRMWVDPVTNRVYVGSKLS